LIEITESPINPESITSQVTRDTNGGVVTFLGTTRLYTEGRVVLHLEYEVYQPMAEKKIREIAGEVKERWGIEDMAVAHRVGRLEIGEISLVVAVASPHRIEAFEACHYAVDRIKEIAPIWKKEVFEDGEVWVGCGEHREISATPDPISAELSRRQTT